MWIFGFGLTLNSLSQRACSLFLVVLTLPFPGTHVDMYRRLYWVRTQESFLLNLLLLAVDKKHFFTTRIIRCLYPWKIRKHVGFYQKLIFPRHLQVATSWTLLTEIASLVSWVINLNWWILMVQMVTWVTCRYTLILWLPLSFPAMMTTQLWFLCWE